MAELRTVETKQAQRPPRLGFLGVGWIGRHRMEAVLDGEAGVAVAVADPSEEVRREALQAAPGAEAVDSLDALLARDDLDGVVIATPSALHADQSVAALERGLAVFCQKPLGRTADETRRVVEAARRADRLLGVDLSYRFTAAVRRIKERIDAGDLSEVYALRLVFHNAYGPDKAWFHDPALSGGGCVMDLGIHLVDLALWLQGFPEVREVSSRLYRKGHLLGPRPEEVEDYATARLDLAGGPVVDVACSWNLPAGRDAVIEVEVYGTEAGAVLRNVNGSFYDFTADLCRGTACERLADPPDAWGGRAAVDWARRLGRGERFDPEGERWVETARVLDRIYGRL